jgi:hypothetical protein
MAAAAGEGGEPGFGHGIFVGFCGFVALLQLALGFELRDMREIYKDFGTDIALPALTQLTIHPIWLFGMPVLGATAVIALATRRPRSLGAYVAVAVALVVAAAMTWWFSRAPIFALAGNIRAD